MPRFTITDAFIKNLRPPGSGNRVHFADLPGFGVCVSSGGAKTFIYNYRIHGRQRRIKIGSYPAWSPAAARNRAQQLQNAVENGRDPQEEKQQDRDAPTVAELVQKYLQDSERLKKSAGTLRNERGIFANIIQPKFGSMRVEAIGHNDVAKLHTSLKATPYHANRTLALLSILFEFAVRDGWRPDNPAKRIKHYHEEKRNRWLKEDEMERFAAALDGYGNQESANAIRLLLLTGSRENEVLQATWNEFDLDRGVWSKPSHHTKQKREEHVPLSDAAVHLLRKMAKKRSGDYLFPGARQGRARVTIRKPWVKVCTAAGLAEEFRVKGKRRELIRYRPMLRIHDLRHNFASHLVSSGVSLHIVGKLLGHTQPQTTARYAHLADAALRDATNRFGQILGAAKDGSK